jgi:tyrosyl-tRNA synthetase
MSKSLNNFIGIDEKPEEMFGKIMSISDELMWRWFELLSFISEAEIKNLRKQVDDGTNPRDIKFILAEELVDRFHEKGNGASCKESFLQRFQKGSLPEDIKEISLEIDTNTIPLTNLLKNTEMTSSTSEAMRLIKQGGVKIDSEKVSDPKFEIQSGSEAIYQVGKRKFLKIKIK